MFLAVILRINLVKVEIFDRSAGGFYGDYWDASSAGVFNGRV